ncbi:hypothetical protein Tco_1337987 [Tanacetum coccineum]
MVGGNGGNQFRQYTGQNVRNQNGNQNGLIVVPGITNQNPNGNSNVVAARAEGNAIGNNCKDIMLSSQLYLSKWAPVYESDGSAEVHNYDNCYDNEIFNMFTQEERYTELFEPIPEPHQVQQNDSNVIFEVSSIEQDGFQRKKSTVSSLLEEKKKLKSDFKIREDELLDKQIQLENKIKELDNIFVKMGQSIQTMHMPSPKPDSFYHTEQKMALGYQNPFYLNQAQQKQQSLYNGKVLLEKHDPSAVYDSEETLQLAQESGLKMKELNKKIKPGEECKYDKISYDKAYNDMQQKIKRLQAQLGDQKGKSKDTPCVSNTLDPLSQKLENENVELDPSSEVSSQESNKPRPRDYTFREWTLIKVRHTDISEHVKKALLKLWLIECFQDNWAIVNNPTHRIFDDYKWEFNLEIDKLPDEYKLGIGKKGYILDNIWEYCNQVHNKNYGWHNYEFKNKECKEIGIEDKTIIRNEKDGTEIHMLAERRYPLIRETLERMMELRLTAESEGEAVFDLLRFIQKQIDEFGGQDGSEKDL